MNIVSFSKPNESVRSASTSASGIFRGLLGNVGSHVLGPSEGPNTEVLEEHVYKLEQENNVLREELESKISENEQLVMDSCDMKRVLCELESQLRSLSNLHSRCESEAARREQTIQRMTEESVTLRGKLERRDLDADKLRRDFELQSDSHSRLRTEATELRMRLDSVAAIKADLESQVSQLSGKTIQLEAIVDQLRGELKHASTESSWLQHKLESETVSKKSLHLQVEKLEDEMKLLAALQSSSGGGGSSSISLPPSLIPSEPSVSAYCGTRACCERAQYYRDQCRNMEHSLRLLQTKLLHHV